MPSKTAQRKRRAHKARGAIRNQSRPRLSVHRTPRHMYAQVVQPDGSRTLASASTLQADVREQCDQTGNRGAAAVVGRVVAERAKAEGISEVAFDRAGFAYHGRVEALADAAREHGLSF